MNERMIIISILLSDFINKENMKLSTKEIKWILTEQMGYELEDSEPPTKTESRDKMFETLTNLNLIKLLTTDQLSIKHNSGNDKLAADVEEAVQELVEDYGDLAEQYSELQTDNSIAVQHIIELEKMLKGQNVTFITYTDKMNKEYGFKI